MNNNELVYVIYYCAERDEIYEVICRWSTNAVFGIKLPKYLEVLDMEFLEEEE